MTRCKKNYFFAEATPTEVSKSEATPTEVSKSDSKNPLKNEYESVSKCSCNIHIRMSMCVKFEKEFYELRLFNFTKFVE